MTYFLRSGNTYRVTDEAALDLHELLPAGNYIIKQDQFGNLFLEETDKFKPLTKYYGDCLRHADRIHRTFGDRPSSTGVMLTGEKGSGKTLLADTCALVLDIHHHWVKTGEYIEASDDRIKRIIDSWRGNRPVIHFSTSREDLLTDHCRDTRPDINTLLESGHKKQHLRAHSDYFWNRATNDWAMTHNEWADMMCESKAKNLASFRLYDTYIKKG